jgi:hypothetical protein
VLNSFSIGFEYIPGIFQQMVAERGCRAAVSRLAIKGESVLRVTETLIRELDEQLSDSSACVRPRTAKTVSSHADQIHKRQSQEHWGWVQIRDHLVLTRAGGPYVPAMQSDKAWVYKYIKKNNGCKLY